MIWKSFNKMVRDVFIDPLELGVNRLCILSKHATPSMASWLLEQFDEHKSKGISVELIISSVADEGISEANHEAFRGLHHYYRDEAPNHFTCSYYYGSKLEGPTLLIWLKDELPLKSFSSNIDFTQVSLLHAEEDIIESLDPRLTYNSFQKVVSSSIYCTNGEVDDYVVIGAVNLPSTSDLKIGESNYVKLSLIVKRNGKPGTKSGLNWGQRENRNPNEAYIPLPRSIAKSGFFPLQKQHFLVVTDDYHTLLLRVEQQNDKAITTPASNAQLGEYFRNRLGLANGAFVRLEDLEAYGRTDVSFYKIDDEQYYMDFSVTKKSSIEH